MQFLNKIEDAINKVIYALLAFMVKLIPPPLKSLKGKAENWAQSYKEKMVHKLEHGKEKLKHRAHETQEEIKKKAIHFKEFMHHKQEELNHQLADAKATGLKGLVLKIPQKINHSIHSLQQKIVSLTADQIVIGAAVVILLSMTTIFFVVKNQPPEPLVFAPREIVINRSPAGRPEVVQAKQGKIERAPYHKISLKQFQITNLHFPVFQTTQPKPKYFSVDLVIELNNRYSAMYLKSHETEMRDHILQEIHPIVPQFPLTPEGKEVIRTKMRMEIESFLRANNVDAEVDDVHILSVMAT